jgi:hypothetical protein
MAKSKVPIIGEPDLEYFESNLVEHVDTMADNVHTLLDSGPNAAARSALFEVIHQAAGMLFRVENALRDNDAIDLDITNAIAETGDAVMQVAIDVAESELRTEKLSAIKHRKVRSRRTKRLRKVRSGKHEP